MTQDTEIMKVVLGGLLHDIGKFGQRAGAERSEEMTSTYCTTNQYGNPGYLHVLYTDYLQVEFFNCMRWHHGSEN